MEEFVEEEIPQIDLDEIGKKYEEKGYFKRLGSMFKGLGKPKNSAEYKLARLELQRQAAPLIAIVSVVMLVTIMIVLTAMQGVNKNALEVTIAEQTETPDVDEAPPEDEPPPPDLEPTPMEDVDVQIDTPLPGPQTDMAPTPSPPSQQVSVKPASADTVAFVNSPVTFAAVTGSRDPGSIGVATSGGNGFGDPTTERAVMKVLWWLKARQDKDGSWDGGSSRLANTSLAVLTYLAHGEYPGSPSPFRKDFGPVVEKALEYINSCLYDGPDHLPHMRGADGNEYAFLIATYALCEAFAMTKNPNCKDTAVMCLSRIISGQSPTGGWDYKINPKSTRDDLSFAGWALQALKAGKMSGLHPDGMDECIKKAVKCLQTRSFYKDHFTYCANARHHNGLTATGCLALQLLGYADRKEVGASLEYMRKWQPSFVKGDDPAGVGVGKDCPSPQYYCYYATQCKYQAGMREGAKPVDQKTWFDWNAAMKRLYPSSIKDLPEKVKDWSGQDHAQGYYVNNDQWSSRPVMDSCLVALQLMVYYRYLPTSQTAATATVEEQQSAADAAVGGNDVDVTVDI